MIHSLGIMKGDDAVDTGGDEREIIERRRIRQKKVDRARARSARGRGNFFASPAAAIVCMLVALGSIVAFWRGVPDWALLAMGMGAVIIVAGTAFLLKSRK